MNQSGGGAPGWYGKLPAIGDFASRRLPPAFIEVWDAWLQSCLSASQIRLGERWLDAYLNSPIWRFNLAPGVADASAWAGVLMPSVDSVGRYFPLTVACAVPPEPDPTLELLLAHWWYEELEKLALLALESALSPEAFDQHLHSVAPPRAAIERDPALALLSWLQGAGAETFSINISDRTQFDRLWLASTSTALRERTPVSLWWCVPADNSPLALRCYRGLPPDAQYADLLHR